MATKQRSNHDGFYAQHKKQAMQALKEMMRRPLGNALTLAVIAMSLALPSSLYLVGKNLSIVADSWQAPSQVSLYLEVGLSEEEATSLQDEVRGWSETSDVLYISPEQGLADFSQLSGFDQALTLLDENPLPAVLIVTPVVEWQSTDKVKELVRRLQAQPDVAEVRLDDDWLQRLDALRDLAVTVASVLAVLMLSAVFLIVGNTLRLNVLAHKEAIQVMKLVGATDGFILRPYLYTGMWYGFWGGIFAWILTAIVTVLLNGAVDTLALLYNSHFRLVGLTWDESLLLLMMAAFLGVLAARLSASKHLKEIEPV
ncbi:permease-like cell division protein FtsX [Vibrio sp. Of7-15]|uniref:permease-like cell division protein FtsX n=1 Tax=Vibrio sp. Of7-15 TaxID=2724879 RepID=UPI001EF21742|nr:permease-like cell division protein FtsX [Vibrio sp. Of7-15]MCG7498911.1 permease-like cell division protein FtsX [Vibrio sp. Of7-15]